MLTAARLRHVASTKWGKRRYLSMDALLNSVSQNAIDVVRMRLHCWADTQAAVRLVLKGGGFSMATIVEPNQTP
jgi:hypothetical protein